MPSNHKQMHNIFERIEDKFKLFSTKGASHELIQEAERQLGLTFSNEYKDYLSHFGAISFGSTELTGLNIDSYVNVVSVTLKEIQRNKTFPKGCYVIENTGIEGVFVLQEEDGNVFEWQNGKRYKEYRNLEEFFNSKI